MGSVSFCCANENGVFRGKEAVMGKDRIEASDLAMVNLIMKCDPNVDSWSTRATLRKMFKQPTVIEVEVL